MEASERRGRRQQRLGDKAPKANAWGLIEWVSRL